MLNIFPSLLAYGLAGFLLLRLTLGVIFLYAGCRKVLRKSPTISILSSLNSPAPFVVAWVLGLVEIICGVALILGFLTQLVAIITLVISISGLFVKIRHEDLIKQSAGFYLLAIAISISLILNGAGFLAIDLPL